MDITRGITPDRVVTYAVTVFASSVGVRTIVLFLLMFYINYNTLSEGIGICKFIRKILPPII